MGRVYVYANQKGGVAKTTSALETGYDLAQRGHPVLIVDGDSQRSITKYMGMEPKVGQPTILSLLSEPSSGISHIVRSYRGTQQHPITFPGRGRLDLIPGAKQISQAPGAFDRSKDRQPVNRFELVLPYIYRTFCAGYEYILEDAGPNTDQVSEALMYAADRVIAPVAAEVMALDGLQELLDTLTASNTARAGLKLPGETELHGILVAKVYPDQMKFLQRFRRTLDEAGIPHFGDVFIPYTTAGWESPDYHIPIGVYQPSDAAAAAYRPIAATL